MIRHSSENEKTDQEIIHETFINPDAFTTIIHRYEAQIRRYVVRLGCQNSNDVGDILQDVFLKAYITITFTVVLFASLMGAAPSAYAREGVVGPSAKPTSDRVTCEASSGVTIPMPTTYLYFEHNSTAGDTGIHGMFDSSTFAELCVYDPSGRQILAVKPQNQLGKLTMAGIFFESREPEHSETSVEEHLKNFPEGLYPVRGVTYDGIGYHGAATLTHNIPNPPKMIFPKEMADEANIKDMIITPKNVVIKWEPVTETIFGKTITIAGYEVIVRRLTPANPHGFAHANYDVHVPPSVTSFSVPNEFWEPNTPYEFEVLALEASGNQTLVSGFFETSAGKEREGWWFGKEDGDGAGGDDDDRVSTVIIVLLIGLALGLFLQKFALSRICPKLDTGKK